MKAFEFLLVALTLASGLILLADKLYFARRRARGLSPFSATHHIPT